MGRVTRSANFAVTEGPKPHGAGTSGSSSSAAGSVPALPMPAGPTGGAPAPEPEEPLKPARGVSQEVKALNQRFTKAKSLRTRYDSAMQSYRNVLDTIATDAKWEWARGNDPLMQPSKNAASALEAFAVQSEFWKQWRLQANFTKFAKATFEQEVVEASLGRLGELTSLLQALEDRTRSILSMQSARGV